MVITNNKTKAYLKQRRKTSIERLFRKISTGFITRHYANVIHPKDIIQDKILCHSNNTYLAEPTNSFIWEKMHSLSRYILKKLGIKPNYDTELADSPEIAKELEVAISIKKPIAGSSRYAKSYLSRIKFIE